MTLASRALRRALADCRAYRLALCAAMDVLHEQEKLLANERAKNCALREEQARVLRSVFGEKEAGE